MEILIFIFIVFVVLPCVYLGYKIWRGYRRFQEMRNDPFGFFMRQAQETARKNAASQNRSTRQAPKARKKTFTADVGEYVEFTEVAVATENRPRPGRPNVRVVNEEQISDVKWEEIREN